MLQLPVVWGVLWWVAWERRAAGRAAVLAGGWAVVQLLLLAAAASLQSLVPGREWDSQMMVTAVLPLPAVFLLAWRGMGAAAGRAHEAVGCIMPALFAVLYVRGYDAGTMTVSLAACFLCFFLPLVVANGTHRVVSVGGVVRLSLAQSAEYWACVICCVAARYYLPGLYGVLTYGGVMGMPSVLAFAVARRVLCFSIRGSLLMALLSGLLLPICWLVCSMMSPY